MKKQKAFTLVEVLIVSIAITVGLFSIVKAIDMAKITLQRVLQTTIANHIAKEGIELVYQQRNTNLLRGFHRLNLYKKSAQAISPGLTIWNTGYYYIDTDNVFSKCIEPDATSINKTECATTIQDQYRICLQSGVWIACPNNTEIDESTFGHYYRVIESKGIYNMDSDIVGGEEITNFSNLSQYNALEFRFCSKVSRIGGGDREIKLCSTMTNFNN